MSNRTLTSYGLGSGGLAISTKIHSGEVVEAVKSASTIPFDSLWYKLFPSLVESGSLTQIDGKLLLDGIILSDVVSIAVGVISGLVLMHRAIGDFYIFLLKRKNARLERDLLEEE
ncbi:hypothetical protein CZP2022_153 [Vibrio phage C-ZP2022]|nr:hypothetical protein CZP2022_153 [Vibrio phage C-ZP2022]